MNTIEEAVAACRKGSIFAFISAGITVLFAAIGLTSLGKGDGTSPLDYYLDPLLFIDAALMAILGIFLWWRKSRFAAVILFAFYCLGKIFTIMETGKASGMLLAVVFAYFFSKLRAERSRTTDLRKKPTQHTKRAGRLGSSAGSLQLSFFSA